MRKSRNKSMLNKILWALQIIVGLYFIGIAGANFIGIALMVQQFDKIGIGQWFRYATAICQLLGGITLFTQKYAGYGALLLACVMIGAIIVRFAILGGNPILAIILLLLTNVIGWKHLSNRM
jgi:putative oxidoreductase